MRFFRLAGILLLSLAVAARAQTLPERLTDGEFWKLIGEISEPGGYFRMDNFTSNEPEVAELATMLAAQGHKGGVYMGVGPEQNFSYIAAIRPSMVFIVDIRRQAVMQHLMYKAIFEMSKDRADFLSLLFSKPRPPGVDSTAPITQIWNAFAPVASDGAARQRNYARILDNLTKTHGFTLTTEEVGYLQYVYDSFFSIGPTITSNGTSGGGGGGGGRGGGGGGGRGGGNFMTLTQQQNYAGEVRTFMASEEAFRTLKTLEEKNLVVPSSGNFGGPKAIRAVGSYVRAHGATVTAFYVSNVEQYLFQDNIWREFYSNVASLPVDAASVFIRPYAPRTYTIAAALCPIAGYIAAFNAGRVVGYNDSLRCAQ